MAGIHEDEQSLARRPRLETPSAGRQTGTPRQDADQPGATPAYSRTNVDARQLHVSHTHNNVVGMTEEQKEEVRRAIAHLGSETSGHLEQLFRAQQAQENSQQALAAAMVQTERRQEQQHQDLLEAAKRQQEALAKEWAEGPGKTLGQLRKMQQATSERLQCEMQLELEKLRQETRSNRSAAACGGKDGKQEPVPSVTKTRDEVIKDKEERERKYETNLATILAAHPIVSAKTLYSPPVLSQYEAFREWRAAVVEWSILNAQIPDLQKIFLIKYHHRQTPGNGKLNALIKEHLEKLVAEATQPAQEATLVALLDKIKPSFTLDDYEEADRLQAAYNKFHTCRHPEETAVECFKKLKKLVADMKAAGRHVGYHEFLRTFVACSSVDKSLENYLAFNMNGATVEEIEHALQVKEALKLKDGTRPGLRKKEVIRQWAKVADQIKPDFP